MQVFTLLLAVTIISCVLAATCFANGSESNECIDSKIAKDIRVSQTKGKGQFNRIQDAINSIPPNNKQWMRVLIDPGTYIEEVTIPVDKQCVILQGNTALDTIISSNVYNSSATTATLSCFADNFLARDITFKNTCGDIKNWSRASAARVYGDKASFYYCHFEGIQDTLFDVFGRHYFKYCHIQGAVDFIWGTGQSVYENCAIEVLFGGFITAQGRLGPNDSNGFVFLGGKVYGNGLSYLGRAYDKYSRVIFIKTHFENVIQPLGWQAWRALHYEKQITYVEADCSGAGADLRHRVPWMKRLNAAELSQYTVSAFIDQDAWISKQPHVS